MWRQALTLDSDNPAGRRWMDGEKTEEESQVSPESSRGAMSRRADQV